VSTCPNVQNAGTRSGRRGQGIQSPRIGDVDLRGALLGLLGNGISRWPVIKQIGFRDAKGLGETAFSRGTEELSARTEHADKVAKSVCPYCAVGCAQLVYVRDGEIVDIEGDPDSPISEGCLCPKGAATFQLVTGSHRAHDVLYRRPHGTEWEVIPLEQAMDMVAERTKKARDENWEDANDEGNPLRRTMAIAHLGGATLDNEENYLIKKLFTALGAIQIENQARI
jgi:formate dehydrogenase major subunit